MNTIKIGSRQICIAGVGRMFHQSGFPIGIAAKKLKEKGIELSWFHVAKELRNQYASDDRLLSKLKAEIEDASVEGVETDLAQLKKFIYADRDTQCEMIFDYLFGGDAKLQQGLFDSGFNKCFVR